MEKLYTRKNLEVIANGDDSFVKLMLETFYSSCRKAMEEVKEALVSEDFETIGKIAHKIKPSVDTVAPALSESVRKVEAIPDNNDVELVQLFVKSLSATLDQLQTDLG